MIAVYLVNMLVIGLAVIIHYEFLYRITLLMPSLKFRHRFRIVLGVFLALTAHAFEVWIFGQSSYPTSQVPRPYFWHSVGTQYDPSPSSEDAQVPVLA